MVKLLFLFGRNWFASGVPPRMCNWTVCQTYYTTSSFFSLFTIWACSSTWRLRFGTFLQYLKNNYRRITDYTYNIYLRYGWQELLTNVSLMLRNLLNFTLMAWPGDAMSCKIFQNFGSSMFRPTPTPIIRTPLSFSIFAFAIASSSTVFVPWGLPSVMSTITSVACFLLFSGLFSGNT